jgi:tagatose 1,6-diphosphate aldolase GatY/KbaY
MVKRRAADFVARTRVDALAVCIGNVHGHYRGEPRLDFERLEALRQVVPAPLVLHGASGLPAPMVRRAIELGVRKLNVNTEVRDAYLGALAAGLSAGKRPDLLDLMRAATDAMQAVVGAKLRLFGSSGHG